MDRYRTYLLVGAPGSGKGTQGKTLGDLPRFFHCACGDVFRSIDTRTSVGQAFLEYSSRGQLVPDEITIELWLARIKAAVENHIFKPDLDHLVLDGIPRNANQARLMEKLVAVEKVFHLDCPSRDDLVFRLKKRALKDNRLDDANEEVIRHRLEVYEAESRTLLEYYPAEIVHHLDAMALPHEVLYRILKVVIEDSSTQGTTQSVP
jgi:adenylate kinase